MNVIINKKLHLIVQNKGVNTTKLKIHLVTSTLREFPKQMFTMRAVNLGINLVFIKHYKPSKTALADSENITMF